MAKKEVGFLHRFVHSILFKFFFVTPISISNEVLNSVTNTYGKEFITLIENGTQKLKPTYQLESVNREIINYKNSEETIVFSTIGRIAPQKNHQLLIDVIDKLNSDGIDAILLIIGPDKSRGNIHTKSLIYEENKNIYFLGAKKNVSDYLINSNAFCLSSLYEGLPISLLESLSLGKIPICTPAGGIVDIIDKNIGLISSNFNFDTYYKKFIEFIDMPDIKKSNISQNCIKLFDEKYSISVCSENYLRVYQA